MHVQRNLIYISIIFSSTKKMCSPYTYYNEIILLFYFLAINSCKTLTKQNKAYNIYEFKTKPLIAIGKLYSLQQETVCC